MKYKEAKEKKMTPKEAIKEFESELEWAELNMYPYISKQKVEADKMAIKALEQESRTGHWIVKTYSTKMNDTYHGYECDQCHKEYNLRTNYCPNCGAKIMESER